MIQKPVVLIVGDPQSKDVEAIKLILQIRFDIVISYSPESAVEQLRHFNEGIQFVLIGDFHTEGQTTIEGGARQIARLTKEVSDAHIIAFTTNRTAGHMIPWYDTFVESNSDMIKNILNIVSKETREITKENR